MGSAWEALEDSSDLRAGQGLLVLGLLHDREWVVEANEKRLLTLGPVYFHFL